MITQVPTSASEIEYVLLNQSKEFLNGKKVQPKKGCNFYTLWVCYKMNLPSDWILI